MKYFVLIDPAHSDAFVLKDDNGAQEFATESAAIAAAKEYTCDCYVVKATSSVMVIEKHKVTKLP
jgi:hypothetical protein